MDFAGKAIAWGQVTGWPAIAATDAALDEPAALAQRAQTRLAPISLGATPGVHFQSNRWWRDLMLQTRHDDGIAWLMLANPPVNAVTGAMIEQIISALRRFADDDSTRVVVLGGEGRHFCAGADLREQQHAWNSGCAGPADLGLRLYTAMLEFPKPMIGMAHGAVAGAGLSMMSCCDLAIAAAGTKISLPEINVGVLGGISHARTALGKALVNFMALTGLPIEAERLANSGLFLEVVEAGALLSRVSAIARVIADKEPEAARYTKRCMRAAEGLSQLHGYAREHALSEELRATGVADRLVARFLNP